MSSTENWGHRESYGPAKIFARGAKGVLAGIRGVCAPNEQRKRLTPVSIPEFTPDKRRTLTGEPFRDQSGMEYAVCRMPLTNHPIVVLDLASVNIIDLFAAVLLTDPVGARG